MKLTTLIIFSISSLSVFAKTTVGPENGTLMIVGGGSYRDSGILEKFIELAGGSDAKFVFVPTASGRDFTSNEPELPTSWQALELKNVAILHTRDRAIADSDEFVEPLRDADAVWFSGGRQWRLVDAYKDTKAEKMFRKVLDRGGIIGGSSAGATIQGSYLARGDSSGNQIMMGDHEVGFGYLKDVAIDQHVLARNRHFDLFTILKKRPELLGIGIDESTAVIVNGDTFEVFGKSFVLIYDGTFWSREGWEKKELPEADSLFYFLRPGDRYDLKTRRVIQ